MKIASKYLITLLALLVYSLGVNSFHHDALPQAIYSGIDGTFVKPAPAAFETNHFHRLPINETFSGTSLGNRVPLKNECSRVSFQWLIALTNPFQLSRRHFFLLAQRVSLGLSIREIIYPFHFFW